MTLRTVLVKTTVTRRSMESTVPSGDTRESRWSHSFLLGLSDRTAAPTM
jgi:hypothetical protein